MADVEGIVAFSEDVFTHYSKESILNLSRPPPREDLDHKPAALWLSDDRDYGWHQLVTEQVDKGHWPKEDLEKLKHRYEFVIKPSQLAKVRILSTAKALREFTAEYGSDRNCQEGYNDTKAIGYGKHIEWECIKSRYKGVLITPYQKDLSHRFQDPEFHWYRFDCASGCFWDTSCLQVAKCRNPHMKCLPGKVNCSCCTEGGGVGRIVQ